MYLKIAVEIGLECIVCGVSFVEIFDNVKMAVVL